MVSLGRKGLKKGLSEEFYFSSGFVSQVFEPDTISFESGDSDTSKLHSKDISEQSTASLSSKGKQQTSWGPKVPKDSTSTVVENGVVGGSLRSLEKKESQDSDATSATGGRRMNSKDSSVDEMFSPVGIALALYWAICQLTHQLFMIMRLS